MNKKNNIAVRETADRNHLFVYQIAQIMGISESALVKKMRTEWPEEEQQRVIKLIEDYIKAGDSQ